MSMYLIYLSLVFIMAAYIYHSYLPYFAYFDEYFFILLVCIFFSLLYLFF